jgi:hypothetical protein
MCTVQAYKINAAQEAAAKEEREMADFEKTLSKLCVRTTPLGEDRHGNVYWHFSGAPDLLFVQRLASKVGPWINNTKSSFHKSPSSASLASNVSGHSNTSTPMKLTANEFRAAEEGRSSSPSSPVFGAVMPMRLTSNLATQTQALDKLRSSLSQIGCDGSPDFVLPSTQFGRVKSQLKALFYSSLNEIQLETLANDPSLAIMYYSCPNAHQYEWGVYCTPNSQWAIWEALDDRGEKERPLKSAIKARLGLEEPPTVYSTTGSEYIGKRVRRQFGKRVRLCERKLGFVLLS